MQSRYIEWVVNKRDVWVLKVAIMTGRDVQTETVKPGRGANPFLVRTLFLGNETADIRLEPSYWEALDDICRREELTVDELCSKLKDRLNQKVYHAEAMDALSRGTLLASALRVFIVGYYRQAATETGHDQAGHGQGTPLISTPFDTKG
jgi:predicted DNA-binding ribbon-helix-helix protein